MSEVYRILYWLNLLLAVPLAAYVLRRFIVALRNRPNIDKQDIVYQEYFASGSSQKNLLTRIGGASNCLKLVVTNDLLWVTAWFPFTLFAAAYDLEHVIPLRSIRSVESKRSIVGEYILLTYADDTGTIHSLRLAPKNREKFLEALCKTPDHDYPSRMVVNVVPVELKLSLREALKQYWQHLIGVAVFPTASFIGSRHFHIPDVVFIVLFLAVMIYAAWPTFNNRVPRTFTFAIFIAWTVGILLAAMQSLLSVFVRRLLAGH